IQFGSPTSRFFRDSVEAPWFAYWLKDKGKLDVPEALTFRAGDNTWQRHDSWPPKTGVTTKRLYFQANGRLGRDAPTGAASHNDANVSDRAHPVPYRARPIAPMFGGPIQSTWPLWQVDDQRHVHLRPDVLSFETEPLADDVAISGRVIGKLFASTT